MTTTPAYSQKLHDYLRELHETASPAPWHIEPVEKMIVHGDEETGEEVGACFYRNIRSKKVKANRALITEARNALPALLAEVERLQERERILAARLARINYIAPITYQLALSAGQGVGA